MITNDTPEAGAEEISPKHSSEQCVPLGALSIDGTAPAQGDEVDYTVKGKIARIEGEKAYVTPATINGEPIAAEESPSEPAEDDAMAAAMKADAENQS